MLNPCCTRFILVAVALFGITVAEKLPVQRHLATDCFYTCTNLGDLTWGDVPADTSYFAKFGLSKLFIDSFEYCVDTFCQDQAGVDQGWASYQEYAGLSGIVIPSRNSVKGSLPPNPAVADVWTDKLTVYNKTIVPSAFAYQKYYRTLDTMSRELYYGQSFGYSLYLFLLLILGTSIIERGFAWMTHSRAGVVDNHSETPLSDSSMSRFRTTYRKYLGTPALFGYSHASPAYGYFSIPTRVQGLAIFLYVGLNVIFCAVGYVAFDENTFYPNDRSDQIWRYLSGLGG